MTFDDPIEFKEATQYQAVKELLPTVLSSKELMRLPVSIRERSFFAAKVMDARFLQKGANLCDDILNPHSVTRADGTSAIEGMSMSKARALLKEYQDSIGYTAPEGKAGTIEDLSSDARLNLIVKMNVGFAQGYGQWKQGQSPAVLDEFPCQELYRREDRIEPRDWPARWEEAGGEFYGDGGDYGPRMIARKDDPIWEDISAFGIPYPPFDFNSGMDVMDVSRDEAIELGVITEDEDGPDPEDRDFNDDLETSVEDLEDALRKPLVESIGEAKSEITQEGILHFLEGEMEDYEPGELEEENLAEQLGSPLTPPETTPNEAANESSRFVSSNFSVPLAKYAVGWDESIKPALAAARAKAVRGATNPAERESIAAGHGAFVGTCGHIVKQCRCGKRGGSPIPVDAVCRQCAKAAANEFQEEQHPRDTGGKFASEPVGPGAGSSKEPKKAAKQVLPDLPAKESAALDAIEEQYPPQNLTGNDTCFRQSDGNEQHPAYTPQRTLLHDKIVGDVRGAVPASDAPEFVLMGGGPASGKSTVIQTGQIVLPTQNVMIDSDAIKAKLPEYHAMVDNGDTRAAGYCHNESSDIAKRAMNESFVAHQNVVLDGTGNSSSAAVESKCALAHAAGFKVRAEYTTCSVEEAVKRANLRAAETGRTVGETFIRNTHRNVSQIFPEAVKKGLFDEAHLWDTDGPHPILVAEAKGTELTIHDNQAWARFLLKGTQ